VGKEHSLSTVERDKRDQYVRELLLLKCVGRERERQREREREKKSFECVRKSWVSLWATHPCREREKRESQSKSDFLFIF
jgi:hypothetical protein